MSPPTPSDASEPPRGKWRGLFREESRLKNLALLLIVLSLADLLMTYLLLRTSPHFYEGNPIARWFYRHWNIRGMTLFKFGMVGIVLTLSEIIERHRPGRGRLILIFACGAASWMVAHGLRLLLDMMG